MLDTVQQFFQRVLATPQSDSRDVITTQLAVAALLSEILRADYETDPEELAMLRRMLMTQFSLDEVAVDELVEQAQRQVDEAVDHFQYVSLLNERYDYDQRVALIAAMWRLAYADHELAALEEHRIRRLADLLYVTHSDFIRTKLAVQEELKRG
ncbi:MULTISPECIES: TerB family tellurite resistance protein [Salinicola]|uniref:TerB family tellurite resistance protein n=1 Tax=Salinicola acroporae TaxID=1541440 RepID=A0ABT6I6V6_9GAMM|nr:MULTISPECIES: TerB family tellurite resistance protein [Salinicola]MDH4573409.1 TerB family tellurite resistance protein [Salinicola acroporae]